MDKKAFLTILLTVFAISVGGCWDRKELESMGLQMLRAVTHFKKKGGKTNG